MLYALLSGFLLPATLLGLTALFLLPFTYQYNGWSPAIMNLSQDTEYYVTFAGNASYFPPHVDWSIITTMKPYQALTWTCLLLGLQNAGLTVLMMVISMSYNRIIGTAVTMSVLCVGPFLTSTGVLRWVPFVNASLPLHTFTGSSSWPTLAESILYFGVLCLLSSVLMVVRSLRHSFRWGE